MYTRIPRPRSEVDKKDLGSANLGEKSRSPQKRLHRPAVVKNGRKVEKLETKPLPDKKSPLREVNSKHRAQQPHPVKQTKPSLHDRRGISEIKRSEQNLRLKLEAVEHEMESLKHEMCEMKHVIERSNAKLEERQNTEILLKENVEQLERKNIAQSAALENLLHDPVSLGQLTPTERLDELVTHSGENGKLFAVELRSSIKETEKSLDRILTELGADSSTVE